MQLPLVDTMFGIRGRDDIHVILIEFVWSVVHENLDKLIKLREERYEMVKKINQTKFEDERSLHLRVNDILTEYNKVGHDFLSALSYLEEKNIDIPSDNRVIDFYVLDYERAVVTYTNFLDRKHWPENVLERLLLDEEDITKQEDALVTPEPPVSFEDEIEEVKEGEELKEGEQVKEGEEAKEGETLATVQGACGEGNPSGESVVFGSTDWDADWDEVTSGEDNLEVTSGEDNLDIGQEELIGVHEGRSREVSGESDASEDEIDARVENNDLQSWIEDWAGFAAWNENISGENAGELQPDVRPKVTSGAADRTLQEIEPEVEILTPEKYGDSSDEDEGNDAFGNLMREVERGHFEVLKEVKEISRQMKEEREDVKAKAIRSEKEKDRVDRQEKIREKRRNEDKKENVQGVTELNMRPMEEIVEILDPGYEQRKEMEKEDKAAKGKRFGEKVLSGEEKTSSAVSESSEGESEKGAVGGVSVINDSPLAPYMYCDQPLSDDDGKGNWREVKKPEKPKKIKLTRKQVREICYASRKRVAMKETILSMPAGEREHWISVINDIELNGFDEACILPETQPIAFESTGGMGIISDDQVRKMIAKRIRDDRDMRHCRGKKERDVMKEEQPLRVLSEKNLTLGKKFAGYAKKLVHQVKHAERNGYHREVIADWKPWLTAQATHLEYLMYISKVRPGEFDRLKKIVEYEVNENLSAEDKVYSQEEQRDNSTAYSYGDKLRRPNDTKVQCSIIGWAVGTMLDVVEKSEAREKEKREEEHYIRLARDTYHAQGGGRSNATYTGDRYDEHPLAQQAVDVQAATGGGSAGQGDLQAAGTVAAAAAASTETSSSWPRQNNWPEPEGAIGYGSQQPSQFGEGGLGRGYNYDFLFKK